MSTQHTSSQHAHAASALKDRSVGNSLVLAGDALPAGFPNTVHIPSHTHNAVNSTHQTQATSRRSLTRLLIPQGYADSRLIGAISLMPNERPRIR